MQQVWGQNKELTPYWHKPVKQIVMSHFLQGCTTPKTAGTIL